VATTCPFCAARNAQLISLFGSQLLFSQYRCGACGSYFEGLREDRSRAEPVSAAISREEDDQHGR
jgi:transposase-like protein